MGYEVLARKWRPKQFADVVGQDHVTKTLSNAIASERVAHAYLFVGPRGTGKTTMARILAKALNCEKGPTSSPCDACPSCLEIVKGSHLDVIEIDGASNNSVEQIRDLRDKAAYAPARGPHKIYIIDEVHMLSISAFNALLKILEEPPAHVKFFFATTEAHKVPATILSRCQRFDLRPIPVRLIVERLREIAVAEGVDADEGALLAVARGAEGGLRDAESALDQLISFQGTTLREEDVMSVFGLAARGTLDALADAIIDGDAPTAVAIVAQLEAEGKDMQRVVFEMIDHFRNLLVFAATKGQGMAGDLPDERATVIARQAGRTDSPRLLRVIDIFNDVHQQLRYALSRRTLLEVAVIRAARAAQAVTIEEIVRRLNTLKETLGAEPRPDASHPGNTPPAAESTPAAERRREPSRAKSMSDEDAMTVLTAKWPRLIETIGRALPLARGALRDARPVKVEGSHVQIAFDPEFAGECEHFDSPRHRRVLQTALREIIHRDVVVNFSVLPPGAGSARQASASPAPPDGGEKERGEQADAPRPLRRNMTPQAVDKWCGDPAVKQVLETFNGDILDIRE